MCAYLALFCGSLLSLFISSCSRNCSLERSSPTASALSGPYIFDRRNRKESPLFGINWTSTHEWPVFFRNVGPKVEQSYVWFAEEVYTIDRLLFWLWIEWMCGGGWQWHSVYLRINWIVTWVGRRVADDLDQQWYNRWNYQKTGESVRTCSYRRETGTRNTGCLLYSVLLFNSSFYSNSMIFHSFSS